MSEPIAETVSPSEVKPDAPRKVAIVGEIPFSGRALAKAVCDAGMVARVLCPDSAVEAGLKALPMLSSLEIVEGNLGNPTAVSSALEGVYGVCFVSPIGMTGRMYRSEEHLDDVRNVILAAETHALRKLVYHSAVGASLSAHARALQDAAVAEELLTKSRCEDYRIRSGPLMGKGDNFLSEIVAKARAAGPFMTVLGYGGTLVQPLFVEDFARWMAQLFTPSSDGAQNGVQALAGPETLSLLELTDSALELLHRNKVKFHAPLSVLKLLASVSGNFKFRERVRLLDDAFALEQNDSSSNLGIGRKLVAPIDVQREMVAG